MAITICVGNYKGGVGKTKNNILTAYEVAKKGFKTLVIDLDPQANATTVLLRTKKLHSTEVFSFDKTLMSAVKENNLAGIETKIMDNLYLLPSYIDFANYPMFLMGQYGIDDSPETNGKQIKHLDNLLKPLKEKYDYIFIDVPPTKSLITDSAIATSDYVWIILQTQELALDGAINYLTDLQDLVQEFNLKLEICGVLPVLMDNRASLDKFILDNANETFGKENIFDNKVPNMARLKRFDNSGITEYDRFDKAVISLYNDVSNELLERINFFEENK